MDGAVFTLVFGFVANTGDFGGNVDRGDSDDKGDEKEEE